MRSILGIDTASPRGSVALVIDGADRGQRELPPGGHSSGLAVAAADLIAGAGLTFGSLSAIAVAEGPGSFTGLRIGLAWAKGIAFASGIPLVLVSSHEAAAGAAGAARPPGARMVTLTPGERRQVEVAVWESVNAARPRRVRDSESIPEEDLGDYLGDLTSREAVTVVPANDAIAALLDEEELEHERPLLLASAVAMLGDRLLETGEVADVTNAAPAYGRAPNARKPVP